MNIHELEKRLEEEGCSRTYYSIGSGGSDVFCLDNQQGIWRVFYTERGHDDDPIFESQSEEEACEFFFTYITTRIRHNHIVGFFKSKEKAEAMTKRLQNHGIPSYRNDIPYGGWKDPRYRVFVTGKDIFKARELFDSLPIRDET
jgi:hypothetical protein